MNAQNKKPGKLIKILVGGLPVGLFIGVVVAVILYVRNHDQALPELNASGKGYTRDMTAESIEDRYRKFEKARGGSNVNSPDSLSALEDTEALLRTSMNMSNMGFRSINSIGAESDEAEINALWVDVLGVRNPSEIVEVRVPYDRRENDDGSGSLALAVSLEVLNSLTGTENRRTIRFAFIPDGVSKGSVAEAYQSIYDNRQVRLIAGFELYDAGDFNLGKFQIKEGEIDWPGVLDSALKTRKKIVSIANQ